MKLSVNHGISLSSDKMLVNPYQTAVVRITPSCTQVEFSLCQRA